jgi:hypothetical protein
VGRVSIRSALITRKGEWQLSTTVQYENGFARRDVARCRVKEPLRITWEAWSRPLRRETPRRKILSFREKVKPVGWQPKDSSERAGPVPVVHCSRGGPIGVVKLLRARGGCLGVIRIRAWKAAKSPGELPNERRARNARATQGTETSQYLEEKKSTETP